MGQYNVPSLADFRSYFNRDFPYGTSLDTVTDADITRAATDASVYFCSQELFTSQTGFTLAFLLLTAHMLVTNIKASSSGLGATFSWPANSHSVGDVSESIAIPQRILDNPEFAWFTTTPYGTKYLMLVLPMLSGQIFTVAGATQA